jgi:flavin reductase (DIM6/NTAB) family NADH-FMN oxidoreductase RutF/protein-L-isoaspartate O-methyltransferase
MSLDTAEFRKVLGQFATGVTVVTTVHEGERQAMTVNSYTSVSLDPPLVLFCADKRSRTHAAVQGSGIFAVNVLSEAQRPISDLFAGKGTDAERQEVLAAGTAATGSPILADGLGFLDCKVMQVHDAGDHVIYIGEVVAAARAEESSPLLYFRGTYQALDEAWRWRDKYAAKEHATRFDELVDFFDRMETESPYGSLLQALTLLADPSPDARCLDIGCGTGRIVRDLAARSRHVVTGVDPSAPMLERARMRARKLGAENVSFEEGRAEALPFANESFDCVTASNLLLHLADPVAALKEAARVLRPGGRLALLEPGSGMNRGAMTHFVRGHGHQQFAAYALLSWSSAAEVNRTPDEPRMAADLAASGFEVLAQVRHMDGLALLSLARRI